MDKKYILNYNYNSWQENHHGKLVVLFSNSFPLSIHLGQIMMCDLSTTSVSEYD